MMWDLIFQIGGMIVAALGAAFYMGKRQSKAEDQKDRVKAMQKKGKVEKEVKEKDDEELVDAITRRDDG